MTPRSTNTGAVLEHMVLPALHRGGYTHRTQVRIGHRLGGGTHKIDVVAEKDGQQVLVSLKWQQTGGTAEQKVPFEVMCLAEAISTDSYATAYLVLGGEGWTLRDFYVGGGLNAYVPLASTVHIVTLERFVGLANAGKLL